MRNVILCFIFEHERCWRVRNLLKSWCRTQFRSSDPANGRTRSLNTANS